MLFHKYIHCAVYTYEEDKAYIMLEICRKYWKQYTT